jgi:AcrR family transcriptional regulator
MVTIREPQRAARTREAVLDAAVRLFRDEGVGAVSAGRIAREAGVSAGNLQYWFRAKQDIVRELFARWTEESAPGQWAPDSPADILSMLWGRPAAQQKVTAKYAFFPRELSAILHADPELAERYRRLYDARSSQYAALAQQAVAAGLLHSPEPPTTIRDVVALLWVLAETAEPFATNTGDPGIDAVRLSRAVIRPLLTAAGRAVLSLEREVER